jgi:hypothetical protein
VIEPTTVWMVHLGTGRNVEMEGILREDEDALVFTDLSSSTVTRFPFAELRKAKRVMGSPVFVVLSGDDRRETAFYLSRPPPLGVLGGQDRPGEALQTVSVRNRGTGKWRQRRENTRYLAATSTNVREIRDAWVDRIRTVMKERGRR